MDFHVAKPEVITENLVFLLFSKIMLRVSTESSLASIHLRTGIFVNFEQIHISNLVLFFKALNGPSNAFIFFCNDLHENALRPVRGPG